MAFRYKFSKQEIKNLQGNVTFSESEVDVALKDIATLTQKRAQIKEKFLKEQHTYR